MPNLYQVRYSWRDKSGERSYGCTVVTHLSQLEAEAQFQRQNPHVCVKLTPAAAAPALIEAKIFELSRLAAQCNSRRDRECLYRLAKEVCIIDQDFESAVALRALQTANRPRLPKGHRHAARR